MLSAEDKRAGATQPPWLIRGFRAAVQDSGLIYLPMEGHPFTWTKGCRALNPTEERLDRALATQWWLDEFPQFKFINATADRFDHSPILLRLIHVEKEFKPRVFKFENAWLEEHDLNSVVSDAWNREGFASLLLKIKSCSEDLEEWRARLRSRFTQSIREYHEEMEHNQDSSNELCVRIYQEAREKLSKVLRQEEEYWKQRSKTHWLRDGDSNTKFFHAMASTRRKRNKIAKLSNNEGDMINDQRGMCNIAKDCFENLFKKANNEDDEVTNLVCGRVTDDDNHKLTRDFQIEEFKEALFSMHSDKAPGPDELNPTFYKRFWALYGNEVSQTSKQWLQRGRFPDQLNDTNIVLIPKVDSPTSMKDLKPTSLCNVLYKIVLNVLANKIKPLLNRANEKEAQCMKKILDIYEKASGQAINYAKSEVYFNMNTPNHIKESISNTLGFTEVVGTGRYLGMPSMIGRNKKAMFGYLKDRMWKKLQSWSGDELEKMINSFWWGSNKTTAMLGKQSWELLTNHDTILSIVFKAKYYPREGFLDAKLGHNPSYVWRSIQASQVIVKRGLQWRIGNGANVPIWKQPWLRDETCAFVTTEVVAGRENMNVGDLINHNTRTWNIELIHQIFNPRDASEIIKIPLNLLQSDDVPIWRFSRNGAYSVRSAYYQLMEVIIDNSHLKVE
ncbi:hypothetical protein A2U01_0000733, partial [Trifolium medium]|nr:hypothetical protein [Trifolium medium]